MHFAADAALFADGDQTIKLFFTDPKIFVVLLHCLE
jgi:hypothetical protein